MKKCFVSIFLSFIYIVSFVSNSETSGRFRENGNGTITDTVTGNMWLQDGGVSGKLNWQKALMYCRNIRLSGRTNWRLPEIGELRNLINERQINQHTWLNSQGFKNIQPSYYWSITMTKYTNNVSAVDMARGLVWDQTPTGREYYLIAVSSAKR